MKISKKITMFLMMTMLLSALGLIACGEKTDPVGQGKETEFAFKVIIPDWSGTYDGREGEYAMVKSAMLEKYKKETGDSLDFDLKYYPGVSYTQQGNSVVADEKSDIDAFSIYASGFLTYAQQPGLLMDLTDLLDQYGKNLKEKIPATYWETVTYQGKILGIPDCLAPANDTAFIRMDVLKKHGINEVPKTIEELEAAFEVFKAEGMIAFRAPYFQIQKWLSGAYGLPYMDYLDENGKYARVESHPNFEMYMETIQRWREKGYLSPDYDTVTWQQNQLDFMAGKQGMCIGWYTFAQDVYAVLPQIVPDAEIAHLNVVNGLGTDRADEIGYAPATVNNNAILVFAGSKNAEAVIRYFDWLVSDVDNYMMASIGIEGTHYVFDREKNTLRTTAKYSDPAIKGYNGIYLMGVDFKVFGEYSNPTRIHDKPEKQKAAEVTKQARAELDSLKVIWSATQEMGIIVEDPDVNMALTEHTHNMNVIFSDYIVNKSSIEGLRAELDKEIETAKSAVVDKVGMDVYTFMQGLFDAKNK